MRRVYLVGVVAVSLVVGIGLLLIGVIMGNGSEGASSKYPVPGRIVATIPLEGEPVRVAVGNGSVWVVTRDGSDGGMLVRVDPASNSIVGQPEPVGFEPANISVGEGGVWVSQQEKVARFDANTGKRTAMIEIVVRSNYVPIIAAEGSVWVADPAEEVSKVMRIDPATNAVVGQPIKVGQEPLFFAVGAGSMWVGSHDSNSIARLDPRSGQVLATVKTGFNVHGLSFGEGLLWVADYHNHSVARVDPAQNVITGTAVGVGYSFEAISAGGGSVWTSPDRFANDAQEGNDTIIRIDARSLAVYDPLHVGGAPADVKVGEGAVWVATVAPNALLRVQP